MSLESSDNKKTAPHDHRTVDLENPNRARKEEVTANQDMSKEKSWYSKYSSISGTGVLIVDDEPYIREFTKDILDEFNYQTWTAGNDDEALVLFKENQDSIRVVMLDILMPGMGGFSIAEKIREFSPHTIVIFASGLSDDERLNDFLNRPSFYFLNKPYSLERLLITLKQVTTKTGSDNL